MQIRNGNPPPEVTANRLNPSAARDRKLRSACKEFEAMFLQQMLKGMRTTIPESGLLEKNSSDEMYTDILDAQVARDVVQQNGGMGIADALYRQLQQLEKTGK